ncbi:hypothetical protein SacmaDRAFT_0301 [Saccharomonospora marina XMU15]|uniref:Uncharacterized protein n=1 Tax=Saccharomonospora marina XMU15 TaxID=882083 RepID=H5X186_9PSEU|nr:hypothetical protein SacmaDRAFT_0301 [Saccharomonospora marina XMU15]
MVGQAAARGRFRRSVGNLRGTVRGLFFGSRLSHMTGMLLVATGVGSATRRRETA